MLKTKLQQVTILGSTGSIGVNTLDVIARNPDRYKVVALTGNRQIERLYQQILQFHPYYVVVGEITTAQTLRARLKETGIGCEVMHGNQALEMVATLPEVDIVMAAIVGAAGLPPTMAAARAGKRILLANKESLVVAGQLFIDAVKAHGAMLLPVDSEHNAIFQSLPHDYAGNLELAGVRKIVLTASGGPFRTLGAAALHHVMPEDACRHPTWSMGRKISVDSATLMNKGLEVIELSWLFSVPAEQIEVIVHPQSIIHSMVQYRDGSVISQMGVPDMRTPIAHAMAWPERLENGVESLDFPALPSLTFEPPDWVRFPCLRLAFDALAAGGDAPAVLNAANEVAVAAFLQQTIRFTDIPAVIEKTLSTLDLAASCNLEALLDKDDAARACAQQKVALC